MSTSVIQRLAALPGTEREAFLDSLTEQEADALLREWRWWARKEQLAPTGDAWEVWLILAGRGFGKTRSGGEWLADLARTMPGTRWAVVCPTGDDVVETAYHGESGLLTSVFHRDEVRGYSSLKKKITLRNGSQIRGFSGIEPERLRGPQFHGAWCDEPASWFKGGVSYVQQTWDMLSFCVRLPYRNPTTKAIWKPRFCVTGTPKPIPVVKGWVKEERTGSGRVVVTRGSTYDNLANLAPAAVRSLQERYEGTRLGRQELHAEVLEDVEGALWTMGNLDSHRIRAEEVPDLIRTVIGVDPAVTATGDSAETGIIVAGRDAHQHGYTLADRSMTGHPDEWGRAVVKAYDDYSADRVVVETNQGGDMVAALLRTIRPNLPITEVTASKGKRVRAEPIAALYEQGRVHHLHNAGLDKLEEQLTTWTPDDKESPDRLDALVWAYTDLLEHSAGAAFVAAAAPPCTVCGQPRLPSAPHLCAPPPPAFLTVLQHKEG